MVGRALEGDVEGNFQAVLPRLGNQFAKVL
jgi:hypothetical protein